MDEQGQSTTGGPEAHGHVPNGDDLRSGDDLPSWASAFPSGELDELRARLSQPTPTTPDAMADLLELVGAEAVRLRATMLRMVAERLHDAEEEAARIRRAAFLDATLTRQEAVRAMNERLQEAERTSDAVRLAALAANRRAKQKALPVLAGAAARVDDLRHQVARLFDEADGLVPSLGEAAAQVRRLIEELDVQYPESLDLTESSLREDAGTIEGQPGPVNTDAG